MHLVLDTNTVVSALLWRGTPHAFVAAARPRPVAFFTSPVLLAELAEILTRRKLAAPLAAAGLTSGQAMQRYRQLATVIAPVPIPRRSGPIRTTIRCSRAPWRRRPTSLSRGIGICST